MSSSRTTNSSPPRRARVSISRNEASNVSEVVNTETGEMLAQPTITGDYSTTLVAVDKSGAETAVKSWSYSVNPKPVFTVSPDWSPDSEMTEMIQQLYVIGSTYDIPGPPRPKPELFVNTAGGDASIAPAAGASVLLHGRVQMVDAGITDAGVSDARLRPA